MTLYDKIKSIHSSLTDADFDPIKGTIRLQNDSDGKGDYIKSWTHPTLTRPTQAQLDEVTE
jgi:hypothetical protein